MEWDSHFIKAKILENGTALKYLDQLAENVTNKINLFQIVPLFESKLFFKSKFSSSIGFNQTSDLIEQNSIDLGGTKSFQYPLGKIKPHKKNWHKLIIDLKK